MTPPPQKQLSSALSNFFIPRFWIEPSRDIPRSILLADIRNSLLVVHSFYL
jgi:hypothetical protein